MNLSLFLARAWGVSLILVGVILLMNRTLYRKKIPALIASPAFVVVALLSLVIGIVHVLLHNLWTEDWRVLITVLGWIALLKGLFRLLFPGAIRTVFRKNSWHVWYVPGTVMILILGVYLLFIGFFTV